MCSVGRTPKKSAASDTNFDTNACVLVGGYGGFSPMNPTLRHPQTPMLDSMVMLAVEIKCLSCGGSRGVFRCRRLY